MLKSHPFFHTEVYTIFSIIIGAVLICLAIPSGIATPLIPGAVFNEPSVFFPLVLGAVWCLTFAFRGGLENYKSIYSNIMLLTGISMCLVLGHGFIDKNFIFFNIDVYPFLAVSVIDSKHEQFLEGFSLIALVVIFPLAIRTGDLITKKYQNAL